MADYKVVPLDLTQPLDKFEIVPSRQQVYSVSVLELPVGAALSLHFGQRAAIPLAQGRAFNDPTGCPIANDGLFVSCPAQPGVTAQLYVGFSGSGVS